MIKRSDEDYMTHEIDEKKLEISDTDITFEKTYNKDYVPI